MDYIASISARHERLALKEPFETAKRRAEFSDTVYIDLVTESGVRGLGASTPVKYVTGESVESIISAVQIASDALAGRSLHLFPEIALDIAIILPKDMSARAGVEIAVIDAMGKIMGVPSYEMLGGSPMSVETDLTIPVVTPDHAGELAADAYKVGFRELKVKVGSSDPEEDLNRVISIAKSAPGCSLIMDANQGFDPEAAVGFAKRVIDAGVNVSVFEQPVDRADIEGLAYVTANSGLPVFADESVCCFDDVMKLIAAEAVHGVNLKLMKSGVFGSLEIASLCKTSGLQVMLGCMLEPRVGIAAALHVACAFGGFSHLDLDADLLLANETDGAFIRSGALISPLRSSGLGCS